MLRYCIGNIPSPCSKVKLERVTLAVGIRNLAVTVKAQQILE